MIYFDNSATTAMSPEALATYKETATRIFGNPSSLHALGTTATRLLEASRKQIATELGLAPHEIFFTSGGTESDNWALKGVAFEKEKFGKHIIISAIEHPAVRNAAEWLTTQGFELDIAPVDHKGFLDIAAFKNLLRDDTILVSVMAVNNEIGSIQPLTEIAALLEERPTISFHVDAVQALGKIPVSQWLLPRVDFASLSAHKFHGPRGSGILVVKSGKRITPLLHGGGQENNLRSTTENLPAIAATARTMRVTLENDTEKQAHVLAMKQVLFDELSAHENIVIFSGLTDFVPNILTFGIKGIRGEVVVHAFEEHEIYLSTTSACASKKNAAASTLMAMKVKPDIATSAVRISLDRTNTMAEVEEFLTVFRQLLTQFERISAKKA